MGYSLSVLSLRMRSGSPSLRVHLCTIHGYVGHLAHLLFSLDGPELQENLLFGSLKKQSDHRTRSAALWVQDFLLEEHELWDLWGIFVAPSICETVSGYISGWRPGLRWVTVVFQGTPPCGHSFSCGPSDSSKVTLMLSALIFSKLTQYKNVPLMTTRYYH